MSVLTQNGFKQKFLLLFSAKKLFWNEQAKFILNFLQFQTKVVHPHFIWSPP
jgi:hypothetical protein